MEVRTRLLCLNIIKNYIINYYYLFLRVFVGLYGGKDKSDIAYDWKYEPIKLRSIQRKTDVVNCGVFICQYLKRLCQRELNLNFTDSNTKEALARIRTEMSSELKSFAENRV
jgi:hypothetical protein